MPGQLGGAPKCPVCSKSVYYYESKGYMGRTWHKKCFNCTSCSKVLESGTANLLSDDSVVCNSCYRRFIMVSTGANKPKQEYINQDDPECCPRCGKRVYFAEQLLSLGRKWHKSCFNCASCKKKLDSTTAADHDGELFCKGCHARKFGPKGYGFAGGSGTGLSMETGDRYRVCKENIPHTAQAYMAPVTDQMKHLDIDESDAKDHSHGNGSNYDSCRPDNGYSRHTGHDSNGHHAGKNGYGNGGYNEGGHHGNSSAALRRFGGRDFGVGDYCPRCDKKVFIAEKRQAAGNVYHDKCFTCYLCHKKLDSSKLTEKEREIFCKVCYGKKFGPKGYGYGSGAGTLQMTS